MSTAWSNKVIFITGASRGIGREIALRLAREGASVALAAKSEVENPALPGTIYSVAQDIEAAGGKALPIACDARDEAQLKAAIAQTVAQWGRIDLLVNNAGYLGVTPLAATDTKKFDLMHALNTRAPLITMRECLPYLAATSGTVLNLCPPLNFDAGWMGAFIPYTVTKYGMTLLSMGFQEEVRKQGIRVHTLWPATIIATAAVGKLTGEPGLAVSRKPIIMADAAHALLSQPNLFAQQVSWLDEDVLRTTGVTAFDHYAHVPANAAHVQRDFYIGRY